MQTSISRFFAKKAATVSGASDTVDLSIDADEEPSDHIAKRPKLTDNTAMTPILTAGEVRQSLAFAMSKTGNESRLQAVLKEASTSHRQHHQETSSALSTNKANYTPLEKQVLEIRSQHPDCMLMVQCGYRMRFFGDDAVNAAKVLKIYCHLDHSFMVASIPTFRVLVHLRRLVSAGFRV
jgi:hypothetical protein